MMSRRRFSLGLGAAATSLVAIDSSAAVAPIKARNIVLLHGLFADGSC